MSATRQYFDPKILPSIESYGLEYSPKLLRAAELFLERRDIQLPPGIYRNTRSIVAYLEKVPASYRAFCNGDMVKLALHLGMKP